MSDIKHMVLRSHDPFMAELHGKKKTRTDKAINLRSYLAHSILQFSTCYGGISAHCTMRHGMDGFGFQMIDFDKHPERWKNVYIPVTAEQEAKIWAKACEMAGASEQFYSEFPQWGSSTVNVYFKDILAPRGGCYYNSRDHVKYDKIGVVLAFLTKARIYTGHKDDMWCSEALCHLLLEIWPDLLMFTDLEYIGDKLNGKWEGSNATILKPSDIHPSMLDSICRTKFERITHD